MSDKLQAALKTAIENGDVEAKMTDPGLETRYFDSQKYEELWTQQETTYEDLMPAVSKEGA